MIKLNSKGLTMMELLAAVVILGILATLSVPVFNSVVKNSKDKMYVSDALKLASTTDYEIRKDNTIPRPTNSKCVLMSMVFLDNGAYNDSPYGGEYIRNQSFVVSKKVSGKTEFYVRLVEKIKDGNYRGINFATKTKLDKEGPNNVTSFRDSFFNVSSLSNSELLNKVNALGAGCSSIYVYAPDGV